MNQEDLKMNEPARGGLKPLDSILSLDSKQYFYRFLPLVHNHVQVI